MWRVSFQSLAKSGACDGGGEAIRDSKLEPIGGRSLCTRQIVRKVALAVILPFRIPGC